MTCSEFERKFNELIDDAGAAAMRVAWAGATEPQPVTTDLERALLDHAGRCPACQQVAARYQTLRRAIHAWNSPPVAPADLADRILAEVEAPASSAWAVYPECKHERSRPHWVIYASALAASLLAMTVVGWSVERALRDARRALRSTSAALVDELHSVGGSSSAPIANSRVLNEALAQATSATFDLARSASEPAARLSRQMLDAASKPEVRPGAATIAGRPADAGMTIPPLNSLAPDPSVAGAMLQEVGDRLASGVVPLSRTARHAFGFLLGPAPAKLDSRNSAPAAKGA